ncbi:MAG: signal recognition particle receptor subunit alpha [Nanoarchaeota archaeon]|nr:signal recognition particle receptor subunit alpha [Nanoarchaeota archaeon]
MLERLGEILKKTTNRITNALFLDRDLVDSIVRDLQRALIEADVNIALVKELSDKIRKIAFDERIVGIEKKEHLVKALYDELLSILGEHKQLILKKSQNRIMLVGLYASGKTTTIAKLGNWFAKRSSRVALIGLDVHRPAAKEQLMQLGKQNNLAVFTEQDEKDALKIWKRFEPELKKFDVVLIDTAGRHNLDKELVKEIEQLHKKIQPTETILVMPADIGQAAKEQAEYFRNALNISGVIITRMDSTAKGGGALTACAQTKAPVYFITTGEKINDLEEFNPKSFLSRLLGMGDLEALLEKVRSVTDEKKQEGMKKRLEEGKLSLGDIVEQAKSMNSLGGLEKIKSLIPGFSDISAKMPEGMMESQNAKISKWEHILKSMTEEEKNNPELLKKQTSRIARIAKGAGVATANIRSLLKQYDLLSSMIKDASSADLSNGISQKQLQKMMKKLGKKGLRF